jgi:hypothetical protein
MVDRKASRLVEHGRRIDRARRHGVDFEAERLADLLMRYQPNRHQLDEAGLLSDSKARLSSGIGASQLSG